MNYPYENLDPEKFQQFCQALLIKEYPNVQCFPVAQRDGGRDALAYLPHEQKRRGFIMFQVKFVRNPNTIEEPHKWLVNILKKEIPKLQNQIPNGAKQFVLITNVPGTSHPEVGSIDQVNKLLDTNLNIESLCWWRDDLNRRLDNTWDLKWTYPELMTGPDLIRSLIQLGRSEDEERRSNAIRAFITEQFGSDQVVRFRQVDLQNRLLELFIDVPLTLINQENKKFFIKYYEIYNHIEYHTRHRNPNNIETELFEDQFFKMAPERDFYRSRDERSIGAATWLLHPMVQNKMPRIVIEGAPGQGKSTITQYVCQVHRMKLLGTEEIFRRLGEDHRNETLENLPELHKLSPVRLPFRIDLRDLATWLGKRDPFSSESSDEVPVNWRKSLESFLTAQVRYYSGGINFNEADLAAVAKRSALLLVFDGLDEVADILRREEVVNEIVKGVDRIEANAASLQVIVTSRPTAFANSPGLPRDKFPYYHLHSINGLLIKEYADKWIKARKLQPREATELKHILREKLDQPHLRDLARNPMQLTIFLSLLSNRGASLPEKRTALYDSYIDIFFNREVEKRTVDPDHRELLINIHRYLAWVLHSEAEQEGNSGSIHHERLLGVISAYLKSEGYDESLSKTLFPVMAERVMALVSRVQGIYEFEVQPLREYFAARYLYETAPYSPPGNEKGGTKPDRFDAIARNFYWLNVTRFYAGCYSKGELSSLIDCLRELIIKEGYSLISHPRILAATLLSDWVFNQQPRSVREVVELILDGIGLRYVLVSNSRRLGSGTTPLVLPKKCGQDELITRCFALLGGGPPLDYALDVIDLVQANATSDEIEKLWIGAVVTQKGDERIRWMKYGFYLGTLPKLSLTELNTILSEQLDEENHYINLLFKANRLDYYEINPENFQRAMDAILLRHVTIETQRRTRGQSSLELLINVIDARRYAIAFDISVPMKLSALWGQNIWKNNGQILVNPLKIEKLKLKNFSEVKNINKLINTASQEAEHSLIEWATEINPWDNLVEKAREIWGDRWGFFHLANISSGIKSKTETCKDYSEFLDQSQPLCRRTRYARLQAGRPTWWLQQFNKCCNLEERLFITLVLMTWGSEKTLNSEELISHIDILLQQLSSNDWQRLYNSVQEAVYLKPQSSKRQINFQIELIRTKTLNAKTATLLSLRATPKSKKNLYFNYIHKYIGSDILVLEFCQFMALELFENQEIGWDNIIEIFERIYRENLMSEPYAFYKFVRTAAKTSIPIETAQNIAKNPDRYPGFLVAMAEAKCKNIVASNIVPVWEVARNEKWFDI